MIFNLKDMEMIDDKNSYKILCEKNLICYFRGFLWSSGKEAGEESVKLLLKQYKKNKKIDFNELYGAYHIIFINKENNLVEFFSDNAGHCCFYYNKQKNLISDSFLEIIKVSEKVTPNYSAITEFIHFNCIYSEDTICKEISRTDAINFYMFQSRRLMSADKSLNIWESGKKYQELNDFISDTVYAAKNLKITDIITGGTDSRTVLAHLASLKVEFDLAISGNSEMIDVKIAKEIADKLGMEIQISNENIKEINKNTLRELFISSDGVYGVFSRYRLHNKNIMLEKSGSELEFGGAAGEFYKNGFINQDFPFYNIGKVNKNKFYKLKINPSNWGKEYLTDNIIEQKEQMKNKIIKTIFDNKDDRKSNLYFKAGHKIMRHRIITISNSSNLSIPSISPFTEVDMMKLTYKKNPWKLEINKWQRNEVSKFFPKIASIKTDRGLTLQNNFLKVLREFFTSYLFLLKIALKRTLLSKKEKNINKRLDIYIVGRKMKQFEEAMDKCKELNVINQDCDIERIPDILADRLMTIGLVFLYS